MLEACESAGEGVNEGAPSRMVGIVTLLRRTRRRHKCNSAPQTLRHVPENVNIERDPLYPSPCLIRDTAAAVADGIAFLALRMAVTTSATRRACTRCQPCGAPSPDEELVLGGIRTFCRPGSGNYGHHRGGVSLLTQNNGLFRQIPTHDG
jgi:hypothetical protein